MWKSLLFLCLFVVGGALGAATREKIAVASDNRAKLSENEIQALTSRIEAKLNGKFNVVTRSALEAILRENQFQTESGLVDDRGTLARFGKVSGVNLLLHYTVAKLGSKYTMSFMLVNCTTGEVDAEKKAVVDAVSFAQLIARMEIALDKMGLLAKGADAVRKLAILPVKVAGRNISPADAAAFGSKLGSSLRGSGAFELLERADLDKIVAESGMVDFELADSGQYSRIAQMSVADDILVLNLTRLENNLISSSTQIAGTNSRIVSTVQANFKLLEVKTGKVIASGDFKFTMRSTEIPASEKRDWTAADYTNALLDRAVAALTGTILEQVDPVLVAGVDGGMVYLTRGSLGGVKTGDVFLVYARSAGIVHPVTKKVIGQAEKMVGTVRVNSVQPELSTASIVTGKAADFTVGAACRKQAQAPAAQPPPAYPMAQ